MLTENTNYTFQSPIVNAMSIAEQSSLPMQVWLRGDESYVAEFSLDAEAVMRILRLKRTRLTQISGRELRVGRIKSGRYIKPLYRPQDVEAYLAVTRAPMSQIQSKKQIEAQQADIQALSTQLFTEQQRAHEKLAQQIAKLATQIEELAASDKNNIQAVLQNELSWQQNFIARQIQSVKDEVQAEFIAWRKELTTSEKNQLTVQQVQYRELSSLIKQNYAITQRQALQVEQVLTAQMRYEKDQQKNIEFQKQQKDSFCFEQQKLLSRQNIKVQARCQSSNLLEKAAALQSFQKKQEKLDSQKQLAHYVLHKKKREKAYRGGFR
ncbi:MAG: hypothetical protein KBD78_13930 [Oligoflexales bacterium]|nr:hypothetical protein [Oligoflexales bacterium]